MSKLNNIHPKKRYPSRTLNMYFPKFNKIKKIGENEISGPPGL